MIGIIISAFMGGVIATLTLILTGMPLLRSIACGVLGAGFAIIIAAALGFGDE